MIIRDGKIAATVVDAGTGFGRGNYAYPYYGYDSGFGWTPGNEYYDLPYAGADIQGLESFEYGDMQADVGDRAE